MTSSVTLSAPPARRTPIPGRPAPSLDDAAAGRGLIRRGMSGDSVRQLQEELRARGFSVEADGRFGPQTEQAVRAFQRQSGARVDGIVGPETMGKLRGTTSDDVPHPVRTGEARAPTVSQQQQQPAGTVRAGDLAQADNARRARTEGGSGAPGAVTLAPEGLTEAQRYEHYARIVRANGGEVCPNGEPTVLGIRGLSRDGGGPHDTSSARRYDDTMVVLTPDGRVREFSGATHPGQNSSTQSPDVTGDGRGDVGMIRPGNYQVVPNGPHGGNASYHVRTLDGSGRLPGWRDTNQDGRFTAQERSSSEQRGDTLTGVLFHPGGSNAPRSIGCQTMDPTTYQQFVDTIGGPRARFNYTLVDAYAQ